MSTRAVAKHLQIDYDTFRGDADPFNLQSEMALLRTLLVEVRETLDEGGQDLLLAYGELHKSYIKSVFIKEYEWSEGQAEELAELCSTMGVRAHAEVYGLKTKITPKEAVDVAKVVESLSKVAERYKKMADGVSIGVNYDHRVIETLTKFVVQVVLRHVPLQHRRQIAASAKAFMPNMVIDSPAFMEVLNEA